MPGHSLSAYPCSEVSHRPCGQTACRTTFLTHQKPPLSLPDLTSVCDRPQRRPAGDSQHGLPQEYFADPEQLSFCSDPQETRALMHSGSFCFMASYLQHGATPPRGYDDLSAFAWGTPERLTELDQGLEGPVNQARELYMLNSPYEPAQSTAPVKLVSVHFIDGYPQ